MSKKGNGSGRSFVWSVIYFFLQVILVLAVITFMPGLPPDDEFTYSKLDLPPAAPVKEKLNKAEKLFYNVIKGPEDFAVYKNELYTGTHGGYIQKISNGKLVPVIKFGKDCKGYHEEEICGRPLGLRFTSKGLLFVCDAYYGVMKVNITTGAVSKIASMEEPIDGVKPKLPNSLAVSELTGDVYWTDSSTSHSLHDGFYTLLADANGRLIKYNAAKGKNEVLLKNIHFANGVALSRDESFLIVADMFRARLLKYYLKGSKAGQTEVFAVLPGFPDNIAYSEGRFSVALYSTSGEFITLLKEWPLVRKLVSRIFTIVEMVVNDIHALYPNELLKKTAHWIGHFESLNPFIKPEPLHVYFFDENGKVVDVLNAVDDEIKSISSLISHQGYYYLGSPHSNFLARIKNVK